MKQRDTCKLYSNILLLKRLTQEYVYLIETPTAKLLQSLLTEAHYSLALTKALTPKASAIGRVDLIDTHRRRYY